MQSLTCHRETSYTAEKPKYLYEYVHAFNSLTKDKNIFQEGQEMSLCSLKFKFCWQNIQ